MVSRVSLALLDWTGLDWTGLALLDSLALLYWTRFTGLSSTNQDLVNLPSDINTTKIL